GKKSKKGNKDRDEEDESTSPGLRAYWSLGVTHASKLGHVDWAVYDLTTTAVDVNYPLTNASFMANGPTDYFALRLVGTIEVPEDGIWRFSLSSDEGARLWIDGELIVNDGSPHGFRTRDGSIDLDEGEHDIEIHYLERRYNAGLELRWSGPGTPEQIVPAEAFGHPTNPPEPDAGAGLWVYWTHGVTHATNLGHVDWSNHDKVETAQRVYYRRTNGAFELGGPTDYFAGRFFGIVDVPESGEWRFELGSDEGASLLIDGRHVVHDAAAHGFRWKTGTIRLDEGEHTIEVRYLERRYTAGLALAWRGPSDAHVSIVPSSAFRPGSGAPGSATGGVRAYWTAGVTHAQTVGHVDWTEHDRVTTETNIAYEKTSGAFTVGGATDYFAARFVGKIDVPSSGSWSFGVGSDESARLFIDGQLVVDDPTAHGFRWKHGAIQLSEGPHHIEVRYLERRYTAGLVVTWKGPGFPYEEVIPSSAFSTNDSDPPVSSEGGGLRAYWHRGVTHALRVGHIDWADYDETGFVDNVSWRSTSGAFAEGQPADYFGLRLAGLIDAPEDGKYRFGIGSDESAQLYINGRLVMNDDNAHGFRWRYASIDLEAGEQQIEIRYLERRYSAGLVMTWDTPSRHEEVVPPSAFSHPAEEAPFDSGGGGLRAYWSTSVTHALKVGHIDWESHNQATVVENVSWRPTSTAFYENGPTDYYALRLVGRVNIPQPGSWTFGLGSDESAVLFINGEPVVVDDAADGMRWKTASVQLDAGYSDIEVWFLERRYSASLHLTWKGPGVPAEVIIPRSALALPEHDAPFEAGGGLRAYWSLGMSHAHNAGQADWAAHDSTTVVPKVHFKPTSGAFYSDGPTDYFTGRFVGLIDVPDTGSWMFELGSDEAAQLFIDDQIVVNDHTRHGFRWRTGSIDLTEGHHKVEVRYLDYRYTAGLSLVWRGPGMPFARVIPAAAFSIDPHPTPVDDGAASLAAEWLSPVRNLNSIGEIDFSNPSDTTTELRPSWRRTYAPFFSGGPTDYFALRLTGRLIVPESGQWT
ncbi:MAG: hypothetical protein K8E66_07690, partial [Phycisphaerales bacterium]|nr:hypothetical protein [Phycisphaerales bacterium]